jgi:hypothetical protein
MSYRNPTQVIDTQTGQHWRNLSKSLQDTHTSMSQDHKEREAIKKKEEEERQAKIERGKVAADTVNKNITDNKIRLYGKQKRVIGASNFVSSNNFGASIDEASALQELPNPTKEQLAKITNVESSADEVEEGLASIITLGSNFDIAMGSNYKKLGGAAGYGQITNNLKFLEVITQQSPGKRGIDLDSSGMDGNVITYNATPEGLDPETNKSWEKIGITGAELSTLTKNGKPLIRMIPAPDFKKNVADANVYAKLPNGKQGNVLDEKYWKGQEWQDRKDKEGVQPIQEVNRDLLLTDMKKYAEDNVELMQQDDRVSLLNYFIDNDETIKKEDKKFFDYDKILDEKEVGRLETYYNEHQVDQVIRQPFRKVGTYKPNKVDSSTPTGTAGERTGRATSATIDKAVMNGEIGSLNKINKHNVKRIGESDHYIVNRPPTAGSDGAEVGTFY